MTGRPSGTGEPVSEFICPGCGRPLALTLHSDMCFAEAQVYCADCEREYQGRRGKWADLFVTPRPESAGPATRSAKGDSPKR
jgi:hypothetical protein